MTAITLRNVPEDIRDRRTARAAREGRSLQEHLLGQLREIVVSASPEDVSARERARAGDADVTPVALTETLGAPLVTLDLRLTEAPGPRCASRTPPPGL